MIFKNICPCALDESSLSIGRVNILLKEASYEEYLMKKTDSNLHNDLPVINIHPSISLQKFHGLKIYHQNSQIFYEIQG